MYKVISGLVLYFILRLIYNDFKLLRKIFGALGMQGGVVVIESKNGDLNIPDYESKNRVKVNGIQQESRINGKIFSESNYVDIPYLEPIILWEPQPENANQNGEYLFEFTQSDDGGNFEIELVYQLPNGKIKREIIDYHTD